MYFFFFLRFFLIFIGLIGFWDSLFLYSLVEIFLLRYLNIFGRGISEYENYLFIL